MVGIGANLGNSQILSSEIVKKEDINKTVENLKKDTSIDGNNNVIIVKEEGDSATVSNIKLDNTLDLSSIAVGKDATLGQMTGVIRFFDNGEDDQRVFELKKAELSQGKPQPAQPQSQPAQTTSTSAATQSTSENDIYKLSTDQAYKFISTLKAVIGQEFQKDEALKALKDMQKELTTREKVEVIKETQPDGKKDGKWGMSSFVQTKKEFQEGFELNNLTDKEFRKMIDTCIKFYDGSVSYENLLKALKLDEMLPKN